MTTKYNVLMGPRCEQSGFDSRTIEEVLLGVLAGDIVYEVIMGEIVPVYDYDEWVPDGVELQAAHSSALSRGLEELRRLWGENASILVYTSSGQKSKGGKLGPFVSLRFIVRGVGKFSSGADMKAGGYVPDMFDQSVYKAAGKRQLMRLWGASKYGEDRPMRMFVDGKFKKLNDFNIEDPVSATYFLEQALAQNVGRERLIEVKQQQVAKVSICESEEAPMALGANGMPLGDDIQVTPEGVRELCMLAGWFQESTRGYDRWRDEMWLLQNTADDFNLGDGLDELMLEVSAVCSEKHTDGSVASIKRVTMNRPDGVARKNLGQLRAEACKKDEGGYLRWLDKVKRCVVAPEAEAKGEAASPVVARVPYLFSDHNAFVGKAIDLQTAKDWLGDCIVMVMNGGDPYFLTRNRRVCERNNRQYEAWMHAKQDKLLNCLNVGVYVRNPKFNPDNRNGGEPEFMFTSFGPGGKEQGFMASHIYSRQLNWVDREDFIPYLKRRIPDVNIRAAVLDRRMFNKFRGYPIEETPLKAGARQFVGSAWHRHLVNDVCHGDATEWAHLEASIADMIQRPYRVSNVAHVFQSDQGTGKRHLFDFMSDLLGAAHTMYIEDMNNYMQKFNEDQSSAILKVFEEVKGKGESYVNNDRLKCDITKNVIRVEIKGGAILSLRHCARYWFYTNHRDTLHVEASDRRYVYHSISNEHANNWEYFEPIVAELRDVDYVRACFEYFAELEYDERVVMNAINTEYKNEQKLDSLPLPLAFVREFMEESMIDRIDPMRRDGDKVNSGSLYEAFGTWCSTNRHSACSAKAFAKSITLVGLESKTCRVSSTTQKMVNMRADEVREAFRSHLKMPTFDWRS